MPASPDSSLPSRVLVVEDDPSINEVVCGALVAAGLACTPAFSGSEARLLLVGEAAFHLVICDLMLPGVSGRDLIAGLRASGTSPAAPPGYAAQETPAHATALVSNTPADVPVIVISARTEVSDRVDLLRCGADDYLVKPFDLDELLARVEVQLRRAAPSPHDDATQRPLRFGSWELNEQARTFTANGIPVRLTRTEFDILRALMAHPCKVFTRRELFRSAWHEEPALDVDDKTVSTHVANIRAKLRPSGTDAYVETVWGIGFKLRPPQRDAAR